MERDAIAKTKKPYTTPTLWVHGSFEALTKTTANLPRNAIDGRPLNADRRTH